MDLQLLTVGDVVSFDTEEGARYRRVLTAQGAGILRTYGLSSRSRNNDGTSLNKYFVTMTAGELQSLSATIVPMVIATVENACCSRS